MSDRPPLIEKLLSRREHHRTRPLAFRIVFAVIGSVILAAGVVMIVTPGPAFVLIPVGLAMLALEFAWAERLLERALQQAEKGRERAAATSRKQRVAGGVLSAGAAVAAVAVVIAVL
jgi:uncharacterized protein (TIGR02611 family)